MAKVFVMSHLYIPARLNWTISENSDHQNHGSSHKNGNVGDLLALYSDCPHLRTRRIHRILWEEHSFEDASGSFDSPVEPEILLRVTGRLRK